jgi:peptide/nickel transport system permease protein
VLGVFLAMYFFRRLFYMFLVVVGVSMLMFSLVRVLPGDPIGLVLGANATKEDIEKMRHEMALDQPLHVQYVGYIKEIFWEGRLGMSLVEKRDTMEVIRDKFPATLELVLVAMILALVFSIPLGVTAAMNRGGWGDHFNRLLALFGVSFPNFWSGLMFQLIFGSLLALTPLTGRIGGNPPVDITGFFLLDSLISLNWAAFRDSLVHIIGPAVILSLGPLANITRLIRANMIDESSKDYIAVNRATGMNDLLIRYKYMLRNAFSSSLTTIGFLIPLMLGSAFVVEKVFAWPGMARFGADAIIANDFNGVVGVTLVICLAFVFVNLAIDFLYEVLDPRIRVKR